MSEKQKGNKPDQPATNETAAQTTAEPETEELPDERDQAELEAALKADQQRSDTSSEQTSEQVAEPPEVVVLRQAFQTFEDGITALEQENEQKRTEIAANEAKIAQLRETVRQKFGGLFDRAVGGAPVQRPQASRRGRPKKVGNGSGSGNSGAAGRKRTSYGDGSSTGDLIASFLKKATKPVNTEQLTAFLKRNNNDTNPSVELSRMVGKGLVVRPSRGFYEWAGA